MKKLVLILQQIILVNLSLVLTFLYYDYLPKVVNAIFFYFVVPILLMIFFFQLFKRIKIFNDDNDIVTSGVTAATIWIAILIGNVTSVQDYFRFNRSGTLEVKTVEEIPKDTKAAYIKIEDVILQPDLIGVHSYPVGYSSMERQFITVPLAMHPDGPRTFFIGFDVKVKKGETDKAIKEYFNKIKRSTAGMVASNNYVIANYDHSIINGQKESKYPVARKYLIIEPLKNFNLIMEDYKSSLLWFFSIINVIWTVIPAIVILVKY